MNTRDELEWKEIKAEQEMNRRFHDEHVWHGVPPVYYSTFHLYLRWVLASIPLPKAESETPPPLLDTYSDEYQKFQKYFKRAPTSASGVGAFLEVVLGEQLEAAFGKEADANDYEYVADTLREETRNLSSVPLTVERAYTWLNEKATALKRQSDTPVKESELSSQDELEDKAKPDDAVATELSKLASLTSRQIALFYIYEGEHLDSEVVRKLLPIIGRNAPTSERQIMGKYKEIEPTQERENADGRFLSGLIKDIEKVIPHLSATGKIRAKKVLKEMIEKKEAGL